MGSECRILQDGDLNQRSQNCRGKSPV